MGGLDVPGVIMHCHQRDGGAVTARVTSAPCYAHFLRCILPQHYEEFGSWVCLTRMALNKISYHAQ